MSPFLSVSFFHASTRDLLIEGTELVGCLVDDEVSMDNLINAFSIPVGPTFNSSLGSVLGFSSICANIFFTLIYRIIFESKIRAF